MEGIGHWDWGSLLGSRVLSQPGPLAFLGEHWAVENSLLELAGQAASAGRWERLLPLL